MSSTHEGVSCDACSKQNFNGRRYKCLICYDFDLCSNCYENGAVNAQHLNTHPMQCILTRADYELYFNGETQPELQSFTCPYCGRLGFTELALSEHVTIEHEDDNYEVVCPICAVIPSGDPNHLTEDLLNHINLEHRNLRESNNSNGGDDGSNRLSRRVSSRSTARRGGHGGGGGGGGGTGTSSSSGRNTFQFGGSALSQLVSGRDGMDPIAELLSQLSGVRRAVAQTSTLQFQQLQAHLRERDSLQTTRQTSLFGKTQPNVASLGGNSVALTSTLTSNNKLVGNQLSLANSANAAASLQANSPLNQIIELPNIFQTLNMNRDNRYLLSRYDNNLNSNESTKDSNQTSENYHSHHRHHHHHHHQKQQQQQDDYINPINQSFFIHDILLATLMKQLDNTNNNSNNNNNPSNDNNDEINSDSD